MDVTGWCPLVQAGPYSDDAYFEALTAAVFQARFRPAIVQQRWPMMRVAFAEFRLAEVADWPDASLPELMARPGMIRNPKKILATLRNARDMQAIVSDCGSFQAYLAARQADPDALVKAIDEWAHYIGAPSIRFFLRCVGGLPGLQAS